MRRAKKREEPAAAAPPPSRANRRQQQQQQRSGPAPGTLKDVCAVIHMGVNDTAITYALWTCFTAKFHTVFIVDATRGEEAYTSSDAMIAKLRGVGIKVHFAHAHGYALLNQMQHDAMMVEVPPDFYCVNRELLTGFIDHARSTWNRGTYRRFAIAPTYMHATKADWTNGLVLLLHMLFSLMSILVGSRLYRETFMRLTLLRHEASLTSLPEIMFRNFDQEPFHCGHRNASSQAPPDRVGMDHFLYLVDKERFSVKTWCFMLVYMMMLAIPVWNLFILMPSDHGGVVNMLRFIVSNTRIGWWVVHMLAAAFYVRAYFPDSIGYGYTAILPLYAILFPFIVFYAKFIWRGYAGERPQLVIPPILQRSIPGAAYPVEAPKPGVAAVPEEEEIIISPVEAEDDDEEYEYDDDEEEEDEEEVIVVQAPPPPRRRTARKSEVVAVPVGGGGGASKPRPAKKSVTVGGGE